MCEGNGGAEHVLWGGVGGKFICRQHRVSDQLALGCWSHATYGCYISRFTVVGLNGDISMSMTRGSAL